MASTAVVVAAGATAFLAGTLDLSVSTLPYAAVGMALVWQRPREAIGWVLLVFALLWSATFLAGEVAESQAWGRLLVPAAWVSEWTWFPALVSVFVVLPILFPTGSAQTPRWTAVMWSAIAVAAAFVALTSIQGRFSTSSALVVDNPWGILTIADVEVVVVPFAMPLLVCGPLAAVFRYRRSSGAEREQIRWFTYSAVACGVLFVGNAVLDTVAGGSFQTAGDVALVVALSLPPLGIWIAVTRHQLYDIDRLISRTVSYGILTAALAGVYALSVFVLAAVLPVEGDIPVALATLVVAAMASPLRRRLQVVVDRRFNRSRYDARRLVESFSRRLRTEGGIPQLADELEAVVLQSMEPSSLSLWLSGPGRRR
jgi:hypothetical protein